MHRNSLETWGSNQKLQLGLQRLLQGSAIWAEVSDLIGKYMESNKLVSVTTRQTYRYCHRAVLSSYPAIIIDGEDVLLLGHHETEASAGTILEWDAWSFGAEDPVDIIAVVQLIVITLRNLDDFGWVTILYNDEMIWTQIWPPLLQEIKVANGWDHNVQLVFQQWGRSCHLVGIWSVPKPTPQKKLLQNQWPLSLSCDHLQDSVDQYILERQLLLPHWRLQLLFFTQTETLWQKP